MYFLNEMNVKEEIDFYYQLEANFEVMGIPLDLWKEMKEEYKKVRQKLDIDEIAYWEILDYLCAIKRN